jgi:hypothetical protein
MKTRKNIYLVFGILFVLLDILIIVEFLTEFKDLLSPDSGGFNFVLTAPVILIPTILFFRGAYRVQKKINQKEKEALLNAFSAPEDNR